MEEKNFWKEFAEITGFDGSWHTVLIGAMLTVGFLFIAGIAEKIETLLLFLF